MIPPEILDILTRFRQQGYIGAVKTRLDIFGSAVIKGAQYKIEYALLNNFGQYKPKGGKRYNMVMPICLLRGCRVSTAELWQDRKRGRYHLRQVMTGNLPNDFLRLLKGKKQSGDLNLQIYQTFAGRVPWRFCKECNSIALPVPVFVYEGLKKEHRAIEGGGYSIMVKLKPVKLIGKDALPHIEDSGRTGRIRARCPYCGGGQLEHGYGYAAGYGMGQYRFCNTCGRICDFVKRNKK